MEKRFPHYINHGGELPENYYELTEYLEDPGRILGVYVSIGYENHPDGILHLEIDEALEYACTSIDRPIDYSDHYKMTAGYWPEEEEE